MTATGETKNRDKEELATDEGHDADIASSEGFVLGAQGEDEGRGKRQEISSCGSKSPKMSQKREQEVTDSHETRDVEKSGAKEAPSSVTENDDANDQNIVWWNGDDDPQNPLNWNTWKKVVNVALVSCICFVTPLASSMFAPGVPELMENFHSTNIELGTFVVSVYVLGFAAGPMVLAPLSEICGRLPIYHFANVFFCIFNIACAVSSNLNMLIGFRFLSGIFGSAPLTNGAGTIADLIRQEHRGAAMATFVIGPLLGPVIGPVAGGYLTQAAGWRWVFWVLALTGGFFTILSFIFMRETYAVVLLARKTHRLQIETGNMALRSKLDLGLSPSDFFWRSIIRPCKMLVLSPIVMSTSLYVGLVYGYLYLLFTTFPLVFERQYHFASGSVGLTYLGIGIGSLVGLAIFGAASDRILKAKTKPNADGSPGEMKPEYRLPPMIPGAFLIPIGLFIYGWTSFHKVQFIVPIFGTLLLGMGNLAVFMCISTYLVDAFTAHAASALAANTVVRSVLGAVLPLAGPKMYEKLGLGWGNSLLGFIGVAAIPIPMLILKYGEYLRKRFDMSSRL